MKSLLPVLGLLACHFVIQTPAAVREEWIARHSLSATGVHQAVSIALAGQGNVIIGGHGTSTNGDSDYVALKYSPSGALFWHATVGSETSDTLRGMVVDQAGSVVLTGTGQTVKWGADGIVKWSAEYGGRALAVDPSGDVYVTGHRAASFSTLKLHCDAGTNLWERTHVMIPGKRDLAQVISVDGNSNVYVGGEIVCYWEPRSAYSGRFIVSYDSEGAVRWQTPVPMSECMYSSIRMVGIGLDETGGLHEVTEASPGGVQTVKYDETGHLLWLSENTYALEGLKAVAIDKHGFMHLAGVAVDFDQMAVQFRTIKISPSGTNVWSVGYGQGVETKIANAIALDSAGNVYVTGQSPGVGTGNDYATIKYSSDGKELWVQRYDGPAHGDDVATAIAVAPDGSVYVTGWSTTSSDLVEITTIKYVQTAGLTVQSNREVNLQFPATPGSSNRVQATTNFLQWLDLGFSIADTNGLLHFLDTNAPSHSFRFYRAVTP